MKWEKRKLRNESVSQIRRCWIHFTVASTPYNLYSREGPVLDIFWDYRSRLCACLRHLKHLLKSHKIRPRNRKDFSANTFIFARDWNVYSEGLRASGIPGHRTHHAIPNTNIFQLFLHPLKYKPRIKYIISANASRRTKHLTWLTLRWYFYCIWAHLSLPCFGLSRTLMRTISPLNRENFHHKTFSVFYTIAKREI